MTAAAFGKLETCDFLIKAKADMNCIDRIGATPLHSATLVQGKFGLCNAMWKLRPRRACTYFTLLRHPLLLPTQPQPQGLRPHCSPPGVSISVPHHQSFHP